MSARRKSSFSFSFLGQEQDVGAEQVPEVELPRDLGQGDAHARQRWVREGKVRQEPAAAGDGQEGADHDVPVQDLNFLRAPLSSSK